jgi:phosphoglycolate phosphatase-like HAD superfamily hydrolase
VNPASELHLPLAVFDIDGVLADVRHRLHHIAKRPKDWDAFFSAAAEDPLLLEGYDLATKLSATHDPLYLTGRPERNRTLTGAWLVRHGLPRGRLLMRLDRDHRPARTFKCETLRKVRAQRDIGIVIDDDPDVIDALRLEQLPVQLATWLPHSSALSVAQEREGRT